MEPSCSGSASLPLDCNEDDKLLEVASILLQLKQLIEFRDRSKELIGCRNRTRFFPVDWGPVPKRRRSAEVAVVAPGKGDDEVEADSPVTPFSFSPSDSEEKPNRLKRQIPDSGMEKEVDESIENQLKENGEIDEKTSRLKRKISDEKEEEMVEIPDLNIAVLMDVVEPPADDSTSSTKAAIAAAEARHRRIRILRNKRSKFT